MLVLWARVRLLRLLGHRHPAEGRRIDLQSVAAPARGVAGTKIEQVAGSAEAVYHLLRRDGERAHVGEPGGTRPDVADRLFVEVAHRPPPLHAGVDVAVRVDRDARRAGAAVLLGRGRDQAVIGEAHDLHRERAGRPRELRGFGIAGKVLRRRRWRGRGRGGRLLAVVPRPRRRRALRQQLVQPAHAGARRRDRLRLAGAVVAQRDLGIDLQRQLEPAGERHRLLDLVLIPCGQGAVELHAQPQATHLAQIDEQTLEAAGLARLAIVHRGGSAVQADLDEERIDLVADPAGHGAAQGVAVRFDAHHEAQLACPRAQPQEIRMSERLAAGERQVQHLQLAQIGEELVILLHGQRPAAQPQVVVTEEAIEIAAIGELDQHREKVIVAPRPQQQPLEAHAPSPELPPAGPPGRRSMIAGASGVAGGSGGSGVAGGAGVARAAGFAGADSSNPCSTSSAAKASTSLSSAGRSTSNSTSKVSIQTATGATPSASARMRVPISLSTSTSPALWRTTTPSASMTRKRTSGRRPNTLPTPISFIFYRL